jgi:hypothetical protein
VCWFNAWMHDDAPHLGASFAAEVAKTANRYRPKWRRLLSPLPSIMLSAEEKWRRRIMVVMVSFLVALTIVLLPGLGKALRSDFQPKADVAQRLQEFFGPTRSAVLLFVLVAFALSRKVFAIAQSAARFVDDPKSEAAKGSMQEVNHQLGQLIQQATRVRRQWLFIPREPRRLIIFVDDLERCRPPRAVEVCEVASQLLGHPGVVTILIADMSVIAASAEIKYAQFEHLRTTAGEGSAGLPYGPYGRLYLQKMVQLQFNVPASSLESVSDLLKSIPGRAKGKAARRPVDPDVAPSSIGWLVLPVLALLLAGLISYLVSVRIFGNPTLANRLVPYLRFALVGTVSLGLLLIARALFERSDVM